MQIKFGTLSTPKSNKSWDCKNSEGRFSTDSQCPKSHSSEVVMHTYVFSTNLGEISYQVTASVVSFCHDIEEEGFNIVIQCFMVQEKFCQQTQVLTVDLKGEKDTPIYYSGTSQEQTKTGIHGKGQKNSESREKWRTVFQTEQLGQETIPFVMKLDKPSFLRVGIDLCDIDLWMPRTSHPQWREAEGWISACLHCIVLIPCFKVISGS